MTTSSPASADPAVRPPRTGSPPSGREALEEKARRAAGDAERAAREALEDAREEAADVADDVREAAEAEAGRWSARAGDRVRSVARALRAAEGSLRDDGEDALGDWSAEAAEQVDRIGGYLVDEDPGSMLDDLQGLARRNPTAFLGTTFALGLGLGRFLRASEPAPDADGDDPAGALPPAGESTAAGRTP